MSERTEVEVLLPLERQPTPDEMKHLLAIAFGEAKRLVAPGRVLGMTKTLGSVHVETGKPALKVRFAVEAPEVIQPQRRSFPTS